MCALDQSTLASDATSAKPESQMGLEEVVYNVPDGEEDNSEVIRAEMLFFNTPRTEFWASAVYDSVDDIQNQCYGDYMALCEPEQSMFLLDTFNMMRSAPFVNENIFEPLFRKHNSIRNFFETDFDLSPQFTLDVPMPMLTVASDPIDMDVTDTNDLGLSFPGTGFAFPSVLDAFFDASSGPKFTIVIDEMQRRLSATNEGWQLRHGRRMINAIRSIYRRDLSKKIETITDRGKSLHQDLKLKSLKEDTAAKETKSTKNSSSRKDQIIQLPADPRDPQRKLFTPVVPPFDVEIPSKEVHTIASQETKSLHKHLQKQEGEVDLPIHWDPIIPSRKVPIKSPPPPQPELHSEISERNQDGVKSDKKVSRKEREVFDGGRHGSHYDSDSDSDSDSGDDEPYQRHSKRHDKHHGTPPPPPPPNRLEDSFFPGALGFGADGDKCLYDQLPGLSPPCINSINRLYDLREQYWNQNQELEEQAATSHHGTFIVFLLGAFALFLVFRVFGLKKKNKRTNKLLHALHADKQLKASVEAQTGMAIPEAEHCPLSTTNGNVSVCGKIVRLAVIFCVVVVSSFIISISSLEITACILDAMDGQGGESSYQSPPTSPLAALIILLLVCSVEIGLFFLLLRGVRLFCGMKDGRRAPSAPLEFDSMHGSNGSGATLAASSRSGVFPPSSTRLQQWRSYAANAFRRPATSPSAIYQPLNPNDESMDVTVHSLQSSVHAPMILPPQGAEMVVVNARDGSHYANHARPVSAVSFV